MTQICQMQACNAIFAAIGSLCRDVKNSRVIDELTACGQAILYAPADEALAAWVRAQEVIRGA